MQIKYYFYICNISQNNILILLIKIICRQSQDVDLTTDVEMVRDMAEDLDVPQMDMVLMERFHEALTNMTSKRREALLAVLEETRDRSRDYLRNIHDSFKQFVSDPCPWTK